MKIIITGPVNTDKYFGGVATFTEGIADAFKEIGHEVEILTDYSNKESTINGVKIVSFFNKIARKNIKLPYKFKKYIEKYNPDLIVSSLEYGVVNTFIKEKVSTIHYLHAFPSIKRTKLNNFFVEKITKFICNQSSYVISNSGLTYIINSEIYNIKSDDIVNVALGYEFLEILKLGEQKLIFDKSKKNIVYIGRLVKEKNIDLLIKAFLGIDDKDLVLNIVGDGPEKDTLKQISNSNNIKFWGTVSQKEIVGFYKNADIFVSLNPHEPYGIVYLEALATNTTIVCPRTGGQMDTLVDYKERVQFINPYDEDDIAKGLLLAKEKIHFPLTLEYINNEFSYKKSVEKIECLYKEKLRGK